MATTTTHDGVFRYMDLAPELQQIVLEKYFESNAFRMLEYVEEEGTDLVFKTIVKSKYSIVNLLLVSRHFQQQALAAMSSCGRSSYKLYDYTICHEFEEGIMESKRWVSDRNIKHALATRFLLVDMGISRANEICIFEEFQLRPVLGRFKNLKHASIGVRVLGTIWDTDDEEYLQKFPRHAWYKLLKDCAVPEVLSTHLDGNMAALAAAQFRGLASRLGVQSNAILQRITVLWIIKIEFGYLLSKLARSIDCPFARSTLYIYVSLASSGAEVLRKEVHGHGFVDYYGQAEQLICMLGWYKAAEDNDIGALRQMGGLWMNRY